MERRNIGPLFEESTSYNKTGIPCGNPQRYESRGVLRLAPDKQRPFRDQRLEAPLEDIETEGDRQLKQLLDKQLNKKISLQEHLSKRKVFTEPAVQKPISEEAKGTLSLEAYQNVESRLDYVNELRQLGLTEDEVELKLRSEGLDREGKLLVKRSKYGEDPAVYKEKLEAMEAKIMTKHKQLEESVKFAGAKYMSRHEMDLEKAISHDPQKAKALSILMTDVRPESDSGSKDDPMNNIKKLLKKVEKGKSKFVRASGTDNESSDSEDSDSDDSATAPSCMTFNEYLKQSKEELKGKRVIDIPQEECPDCARSTIECYYHSRRKKADEFGTLNDYDENRLSESKETTGKKKKKKKHKKKQTGSVIHQTIELKQTVHEADLEPIPLEVIEKYRITVDEIKQLDRFADYSAGQSNKTLYIKNLSAKVTERDLRTMFMRYEVQEGPSIEYRLLTGRMKGQAFVTFPDVTSATRALNTVNGYNFKGKPIIIQYGRNKE